jgi:hypothetical protein
MRLLLTLFALWALLVPTLCLAGAFGHACGDCGDEATCAHEEECVEDPCSEEMIRPAPGGGGPDLGPGIPVSVSQFLLPAPAAPVSRTIPRPPDIRLPLPESDLPLRS